MSVGPKQGWRDLVDTREFGKKDGHRLILLYPYAAAGWNWATQTTTLWTSGGSFYPVDHWNTNHSYPSDDRKFIGSEKALAKFWSLVDDFLQDGRVPRIFVPIEAPQLEGTIIPDIVTRAEIKPGVNRNPAALREFVTWPYEEIIAYLRGNEPPRKPDTSYEYGVLQAPHRKDPSFEPEGYFLHRPILDKYDGDGYPPLVTHIRFHDSDHWDNPDRYTEWEVTYYSKEGRWYYDGDPYIKDAIDRHVPFSMIMEAAQSHSQIAVIWRKKLGEYTSFPVLFRTDQDYQAEYNRLYTYEPEELERAQVILTRLMAMSSFAEKFEKIQQIGEELGYSVEYSNSPFGYPREELSRRGRGETCVSIVFYSQDRRVDARIELDPVVEPDYDQIRDVLSNAHNEVGCIYSNKTV